MEGDKTLYKHLLLTLFFSLLLLGCSADNSSNNAEKAKANTDSTNQATESPDYEEILGSYEEFHHLEDTIANIAALEIEVLEDNANKRVILFTDNHDIPAYKSIYTKHDSHLKIIQLNTNKRPLFDEDI